MSWAPPVLLAMALQNDEGDSELPLQGCVEDGGELQVPISCISAVWMRGKAGEGLASPQQHAAAAAAAAAARHVHETCAGHATLAHCSLRSGG